MQRELDVLRELQNYDMEIEQIQEQATSLQSALDEHTTLHDALAAQLDDQKSQLDETQRLMRQKTGELEENATRYSESREKLNRVSNAREYNALENELESLRKMRAQLEEELEQLKDAVADSKEDVEAKQEKVDKLAKEIRTQQKHIDEVRADAEKRSGTLQTKRGKLKEKFAEKKGVIRRYEFIRSRLDGEVIVAATEKGVCTGCRMTLPPQLYNQLLRGENMTLCPNCQRILYPAVQEEGAAEDS